MRTEREAPAVRTFARYMTLRRLAVFVAFLTLQFAAQADQPARFAAASSLQFVLPEILLAFQRKTGYAPRITYGSSGNFSRQISQGAPFELFLSADESYVAALVRQGLTVDSGRIYALGSIAAIAPKQANIRLTQDLSGFRSAIESGELKYFAIANPDHAPYGRAAREAMQSAGLWQAIQPHLVRGENASQAAQFAISGSSQGGIVPFGLTKSPAIATTSHVMLIPPSYYQPVRQRMVLMNEAGTIARQFFDFVGGPEAGEIFLRHGYRLPDSQDRHTQLTGNGTWTQPR